MQDTTKERFMYFLGGFVVACAAIVVGMTLILKLPQDSGTLAIISMAIGQLLGMAVTVVGYFFGSSKSSADKNALLSNSEPSKPDA